VALFFGRKGARYALAAVAFAGVALAAQYPASRLHAGSRRKSSLFRGDTEAKRVFLERQTTSMYLPQSRSLHYFWLGNDGLAASFTWMKSATYMSREFSYRYSGRKFEWLKKLYGAVVDLDPHWQGACKLGGLLLSAVGEDPAGALEVFDRGIAANPDSWRLCYEAGLVCLLAPGRSEEAARYFRMAELRPGCPDVVRQVVPRIMAEAGRIDLAIRHARELALRFRGQAMGESMVRELRRLVSRQGERLLARAVELYRERNGTAPRELADVRRAGLLRDFDLAWAEGVHVFADGHERLLALSRERNPDAPAATSEAALREIVASGFLNVAVAGGEFPPPESTDAIGRPFRYHGPSGTVRSEGLAAVDAWRTLSVLRSSMAKFRSAKRRSASSLDELARFFGEWIRAGKSLQQEWTETFRDGRAPVHPLAPWGERYVYDPLTGSAHASWPEGVRPKEGAVDGRGDAGGPPAAP
jgi:tetratricopeptide (TPR) repeat protein